MPRPAPVVVFPSDPTTPLVRLPIVESWESPMNSMANPVPLEGMNTTPHIFNWDISVTEGGKLYLEGNELPADFLADVEPYLGRPAPLDATLGRAPLPLR